MSPHTPHSQKNVFQCNILKFNTQSKLTLFKCKVIPPVQKYRYIEAVETAMGMYPVHLCNSLIANGLLLITITKIPDCRTRLIKQLLVLYNYGIFKILLKSMILHKDECLSNVSQKLGRFI